MSRTFDHLLLLGRPAAGKSEFIDFMKKTPDPERAEVFHIGRFEELDDFVWLWEKFLEDDLWEETGLPRLYSKRYEENYGMIPDQEAKLFELMFTRFNHELKERYLSRPEFYKEGTVVVEFARGGDDGYKHALSRLSKEVLERAAVLYVQVTFDESWRRNVARYEEKQKHSILAHMVPRETMDTFYSVDDWSALTAAKTDGMLNVNGVDLPFVTMSNEPELNERGLLADRYGSALQKLMDLKAKA
jgi:hypothetical protein